MSVKKINKYCTLVEKNKAKTQQLPLKTDAAIQTTTDSLLLKLANSRVVKGPRIQLVGTSGHSLLCGNMDPKPDNDILSDKTHIYEDKYSTMEGVHLNHCSVQPRPGSVLS